MPDALIPLDMGFAEFAAKLIAEVFEAVANSTTDQEERYADLVKAASLTPDEYASRMITADQVTAELARLFPARQAGQPHAVVTGAPYKPAGRNRLRTPGQRDPGSDTGGWRFCGKVQRQPGTYIRGYRENRACRRPASG